MTMICILYMYFVPETHLFHTISATAVSLGMIIASIRLKSYRYLAAGAGMIVLIFLNQTADFWLSLNWWIYAAIVAFLIIGIGTGHEILRRKGSSYTEIIQSKKPSDWTF